MKSEHCILMILLALSACSGNNSEKDQPIEIEFFEVEQSSNTYVAGYEGVPRLKFSWSAVNANSCDLIASDEYYSQQNLRPYFSKKIPYSHYSWGDISYFIKCKNKDYSVTSQYISTSIEEIDAYEMLPKVINLRAIDLKVDVFENEYTEARIGWDEIVDADTCTINKEGSDEVLDVDLSKDMITVLVKDRTVFDFRCINKYGSYMNQVSVDVNYLHPFFDKFDTFLDSNRILTVSWEAKNATSCNLRINDDPPFQQEVDFVGELTYEMNKGTWVRLYCENSHEFAFIMMFF